MSDSWLNRDWSVEDYNPDLPPLENLHDVIHACRQYGFSALADARPDEYDPDMTESEPWTITITAVGVHDEVHSVDITFNHEGVWEKTSFENAESNLRP